MKRARDLASLGQGRLKIDLLAKSRTRRSQQRRVTEIGISSPPPRNDLLPGWSSEDLDVTSLRYSTRRLRKLTDANIAELTASLCAFGFCRPIIVGRDNLVIDGEGLVEAAKRLGLPRVPCVRIDHLTSGEEKALRIALNRLGEKRSWDSTELALELKELQELEISLDVLGFESSELDILLMDEQPAGETFAEQPGPEATAVTRLGDLWLLGEHRLLCGDALAPGSYQSLMGAQQARLLLTDPPFNCCISKTVSTQHREFAQASGEMSEQTFLQFLTDFLRPATDSIVLGAVALVYMDWRQIERLLAAGRACGLEQLNLIVWVKDQAGMGSLWRSQHELIVAFKKPGAPHKNNVQLGAGGRYRSNCWFAPGAGTVGSSSREWLSAHPTPKNVEQLVDAILDVTDRSETVLDPFAGSGSTLIACQKTGRACRAIELDPLYCDLILSRWSSLSGEEPVLASTGERFRDVAEARLEGEPGMEERQNDG